MLVSHDFFVATFTDMHPAFAGISKCHNAALNFGAGKLAGWLATQLYKLLDCCKTCLRRMLQEQGARDGKRSSYLQAAHVLLVWRLVHVPT